jgi:hypothetical protein
MVRRYSGVGSDVDGLALVKDRARHIEHCDLFLAPVRQSRADMLRYATAGLIVCLLDKGF